MKSSRLRVISHPSGKTIGHLVHSKSAIFAQIAHLVGLLAIADEAIEYRQRGGFNIEDKKAQPASPSAANQRPVSG